jgi:hypothetical protein
MGLIMQKFVRRLFAAALGAVILSCGESPTGPKESGSGLTVATDAVTSEGPGGPAVTTDKADYSPGDTVTVTGAGWQPNETISLVLTEDPAVHDPTLWNVAADSVGTFTDRSFIIEESHVGVAFSLVATGAASADTAQGTFTDGNFKAKTNFGTADVDWKSYSNLTCAGSPSPSGTAPIGTGSPTLLDDISSTESIKLEAKNLLSGTTFLSWSNGSIEITDIIHCFAGNGATWTLNLGINTSTAVTANVTSPQIAGAAITFSAAVTKDTDNSALNNGGVAFFDGGTCAAPGAMLQDTLSVPGSGIVTFATSSLSVGAHNILACYIGGNAGGTPLLPSDGAIPFTIDAASVATATSVIPSPASPSEFGTSVTFTATVTQTSGGAAVTSGNVSFHDASCAGDLLQAGAALDVSGQKTYTTSALEVGAHTIVACYEGASGFDASNGSASYTINKIATTTAITTNLSSPQNVGAAVTFTATVTRNTGGAAVTVGNVRFIEGTCAAPTSTLQAGAAVNPSGQVTYSGSTLAAGAHTIVACYDGDTNYDISQDSESFTFNLASTSTTVTPNPLSPSEYGTSVTFTAAVTSGGTAVSGGNVRFIEGGSCASPGTTLQSATAVDGSGEVTYTTNSLSIAAHTIVACYDANSSHDASNGSTVYDITKVATTTGVTANVTTPQEYGTSVTFTAEVNRNTGGADVTTGSIAFYDGETCTTPGAVLQAASPVDGTGKVSLVTSTLSIGTHTIRACYEGTATFGTSSGSMSFEISKIATSTTLTAVPASPQEFGTSVTFTAEVNKTSGGDVTSGSVTFYDSGSCAAPGTSLQSATGVDGFGKVTLTTTSLSAAAHTIVACYGGNTTFEASGDDIPYIITPIATATSVVGSPITSVTGQSVTFTANVTMHSGADAVTSGSVTFRTGGTNCADGTVFSGPTSVNGLGQATGSRSFNATESGATIRACYSNSNTNYDPSSGTTTQTVDKAVTSPTLTSNNNSSEFGENVTLGSTVSATSPGSGTPTGTVSFYEFAAGQSCSSLGGASAIATETLAKGAVSTTLNTLSVGTHVLTACYSGDSNFLSSASSTLSQVVDPKATGTVLGVSPASQQYSDIATFTATVTPFELLTQQLTGDAYFYVGASPQVCGTSAPSGYVRTVAISDSDNGVDTVLYKIDKPAGTYTVTACFYSSNGSFAHSSDTETLTVTAENATVYDVGYSPDPAQVTSAGGSSNPIVLSLKVKEKYPESNSDLALARAGDVDNLTVQASGKGVLNPSGTAAFNCVKGAVTGSGYTRYAPWTCTTTTGLAADTWDVTITVGPTGTQSFYAEATSTVIQVTDPSLGFSTGGGWYTDANGDRVNFGFMAKATVNNRKTVYQGSLLAILHKANGDEIRIKSNVFDGYSIGSGSSSNTTTFTGKANYSVNGLSDGNYTFTGYGQDNGTPGAGVDLFGLYLARAGNEIGTSATLSGLAGSALPLKGGNIQVPQPSKK